MSPGEPIRSPAAPNLYGLDREGLSSLLAPLGAPSFAAEQVFRWMYGRGQLDPETWTDLARPLRKAIAASFRVDAGRIVDRAEASDGTVKFRLALADGGSVETVYMVDRGRVTLCLSSQVGCALDCDFCLTAKMGLVRHLTPGEIVGQIAQVRADRACDDRPVNLVFMGMGEPLHNYDGVMAAVRILADRSGPALSRKRITVSTAGLAPAIERLAAEPVRPRLAVSLNATTDALRDRLMPVNRRYPIARLLDALRTFARSSGEPFTLEYVLLGGVNDSDEELRRLGRIVRSLPAKLNLIPFNPVPGWLPYVPPSLARILAIRDRLLAEAVPVSVRWSRGADARAACGQLALLDGDGRRRPGDEP